MAIFQPSQVVPDVRSGLGLGVVDATQGIMVSWHIAGASAMVKYSIRICANDSDSTQIYSTGPVTGGCPAYGTSSTGEFLFFSYKISAATLAYYGITNGNEYKLIIQQWWSASDSVTQSSASVFVTRAAPTLSISTIGTGGVISTRSYAFTGNYSQAQGDTLNWFRWQIATADNTDDPFFDSGEISGTADIACEYDGFFANTSYAIRLTAQTENGVEADTGWVTFSAAYSVSDTDGEVTAGCVGGTDAVLVEWSGIGYIPGVASGTYSISNSKILTLNAGSSVSWSQVGTSPMSFASPWSLIWKGTLGSRDATVFTIGQSGGDLTLSYQYTAHRLVLAQGGTTLLTQTGIINNPTVTVILTATALYIRTQYKSGGLYPTTSLYPTASLYPKADSTNRTDTYTLSPSYTQSAVTGVSLGGYQTCNYMELISGAASAETITAAITNGTYTPGLTETDYMLADWADKLNAGTLNIGGQEIVGFTVYRMKEEENALTKVAETDALTSKIYDYGAVSQGGPYTYYLFPTGSQKYIASPLRSGTVMPCWWNWTLMECEETDDKNAFTVLAAYRFRYNIETGAMSNNNTPTVLNNFTPYPKIQPAPQNYKSGSLTGLIGVVDWSDGQPDYVDTIAWRDAIFALSVSQNPLFLKSRKGDLFRIRLTGAITIQTDDKTREQTQTMTLPWAEVGLAENVSLYSTAFAGVQEEEGTYTPQYYMDTSDATADEANIRIMKVAYGESGRMVGSAAVAVEGTTLVMPEGMEE